MSGARFEQARHVLAVRLDNIGDVLMTTPALRALKRARPDRRLTLLASRAGAAVARLVPEIDEVIAYEAPWMKASPPRVSAEPDLGLVSALRGRRFDAAAIFTVYSQSALPAALLCTLAEIPLRAAYSRENPYALLTHWLREIEPHERVRHEVERQLDLAAHLGAPAGDERLSLRVPAAARARVARALGVLELDGGRPLVLVHPGASAPSRRYPAARFAEATRGLVRELGCDVVFTGAAGEVALVEAIRAAAAVETHSLAGALELAELAALVERATLLVVNNTGPAHVAAALGTPVVELYALTNPQHTPWRVPHRLLYHDVPCRNCYRSVCPERHQHCLSLVPAGAVVAAARELLEKGAPAS